MHKKLFEIFLKKCHKMDSLILLDKNGFPSYKSSAIMIKPNISFCIPMIKKLKLVKEMMIDILK